MACCQVMNLSSRWRWSTENVTFEGVFKEQCQPRTLAICINAAYSNSSEGHLGKTGKLKASKSPRSTVDLRKELQEFISAAGLPSDQVPSMKELSHHGRQDLANIVRRRGYKAIAQLLTDPEKTCTPKNTGKQQMDRSTAESDGKEYEDPDSARPVEIFNVLLPNNKLGGSEDIYFSFRKEQGNFHDEYTEVGIIDSNKDWLSGENCFTIHNNEAVNLVEGNSHYSLQSSLDMSLHERAADFVRTGEFHDIEGGDENQEDRGDEASNDNTCKAYGSNDAVALTPHDMDSDKASYGTFDCYSEFPSISGNMAVKKPAYESYECKDRTQLTFDSMAAKEASLWTTKVQQFFRDKASNPFVRKLTDELQFNVDRIPEELASQSIVTSRTLMEIDQFKSVLRLKELELAKVRRELEEEKAALSFIQAKAMAEVAHVRQIVSEKDSQLSAANQVLSYLKQVQIEYWGDGQIVEVTGSFNGWQHRIAMEPDTASEIRNPNGARGPSMWSTELWLYPGIYEIKFIVDGTWQVDSRREVITRDTFQNNILKVEK